MRLIFSFKQPISFPCFLAHLLLLSSLQSLCETKTHQTPNIVLFMVDDMGIGDCSSTLDLSSCQLFSDHPNPEDPKHRRVCPRRHDFHGQCHGIHVQFDSLLFTDRTTFSSFLSEKPRLASPWSESSYDSTALTTLPEMLQRNGYRTCAIGKYR